MHRPFYIYKLAIVSKQLFDWSLCASGDNPNILYTNAALFVSPTADEVRSSFYRVQVTKIN